MVKPFPETLSFQQRVLNLTIWWTSSLYLSMYTAFFLAARFFNFSQNKCIFKRSQTDSSLKINETLTVMSWMSIEASLLIFRIHLAWIFWNCVKIISYSLYDHWPLSSTSFPPPTKHHGLWRSFEFHKSMFIIGICIVCLLDAKNQRERY